MRRMEAWEAEGGLSEYFIDCPGELDGLRERYKEIGAKVRRAYGLARGPAAAAAASRRRRAWPRRWALPTRGRWR